MVAISEENPHSRSVCNKGWSMKRLGRLGSRSFKFCSDAFTVEGVVGTFFET
jgi:hypothetical protein